MSNQYENLTFEQELELRPILKDKLIRKHNNGKTTNRKCDYCQVEIFYLDLYSDEYRKLLNDEENRKPKHDLVVWEFNEDGARMINNKLSCRSCRFRNQEAIKDQDLIEAIARNKRLKKSIPLRKLIKVKYTCPMCEKEHSTKSQAINHLADHDDYDINERKEIEERKKRGY